MNFTVDINVSVWYIPTSSHTTIVQSCLNTLKRIMYIHVCLSVCLSVCHSRSLSLSIKMTKQIYSYTCSKNICEYMLGYLVYAACADCRATSRGWHVCTWQARDSGICNNSCVMPTEYITWACTRQKLQIGGLLC